MGAHISTRMRHVVQALVTIAYNPHVANFVTGHIYRGQTKSLCVPGLNCYSCPAAMGACPVGSLQSFLAGAVPRFPAYVVGLIALFGFVLGRVVCGWGCPFGLLQEILYKLPTPKVRKSRVTFFLSRMKYVWAALFVVVLPLVFWAMFGAGEPTFCKYICPAGTLEGAVPIFLANEKMRSAAGLITAWKFAVMLAFLALMVFLFRPFCRFVCPLGAAYGMFNRHAIFGIKVDNTKCISCGECARLCKMDTRVAGDAECVSCGDCVGACPTGAIYFGGVRKRGEAAAMSNR